MYQLISFIIVILVVLKDSESFSSPIRGKRIVNIFSMSSSENVLVVGRAGGVAEAIACKLSGRGISVSSVLDRKPYSTVLLNDDKIKCFIGDVEEGNLSGLGSSTSQTGIRFASLANGKIIIIAGDAGDSELRMDANDDPKKDPIASLFNKISKSIPTNIKAIVCAVSASSENSEDNAFAKLLSGQSSFSGVFRKLAIDNNIPLSVIRFGDLTGGVPGAEPLAFVGLPLLEPELHPSYVLNSVVLTPSTTKYSASEPCTRDALAECITRVVEKGLYKGNIAAQVISIAGNLPTEKEWTQVFNRLTAGSNVELLRVEFGAVLKQQPMINWIADSWFPQALIDADAAVILTGARPVRALKKASGAINIVWENLQADLTAKKVGEVEIRLIPGTETAAPALTGTCILFI